MAKKKEPILKFMRTLLDKHDYKNVGLTFSPRENDIFSVGKSHVRTEITVEVCQGILNYTTDEIKDTLLEPIILLNIEYKDKCKEGFQSKHWDKWAKKLGYKELRKPDIIKQKTPKMAKALPMAESISLDEEKPKPKASPAQPIRREQASAIGADEADSVLCKLTSQTALYDIGEYKIVRFKSSTVKVYDAKGTEVKAMGFLKAVNNQYSLGFKTEGTNTRSLGKKVIDAIKRQG